MSAPAHTVRLGYAVGTGDRVEIPIRHMVVCGQTQESGKTTTLEALLERAGLQALTFVTKHGEGAFRGARQVDPYFQEQHDNRWRFVASMLEAHMGERMKFERNWIEQAARGTKTLDQVRDNARRLAETSKSGFNQDQFRMLAVYLEELVPQLAAVTWARRVQLQPRIVSCMDLVGMPMALQHLVIRSALAWVQTHAHDTLVVVPEAWQFIPQDRSTPVKLAAVSYIRQGAALRNYLWMDSQDMGGIDKELLRSVVVWLVGVQREANELKRTLSNIPAPARPKAEDVALLELGQFIACWGKHAIRTYVQPAWLPEAHAYRIARGDEAIDDEYVRDARPRHGLEPVSTIAHRVRREGSATFTVPAGADVVDVVRRHITPLKGAPDIVDQLHHFVDRGRHAQATVHQAIAEHTKGDEGDEMNPQQERKLDDLVAANHEVATSIKALAKSLDGRGADPTPGTAPIAQRVRGESGEWMDLDAVYDAIKRRLIADAADDPRVLEVLVRQPAIRVKVERHVIQVDGDTMRGRIALLIRDGFLDAKVEAGKVFAELGKRGFKTAHPNVVKELDELTRMGFLTKAGKWYTTVEAMKRNVQEA
jgi:hypothetical protein